MTKEINTQNNGRFAVGTVGWSPSYGTTIERVFRQLPALFNESWLKDAVGDMDKAFDVPNAVYPYDIKAVKNKEGVAEKYIVEVALAGIGRDNIDVKVRDGHLFIGVNKEGTQEDAEGSYIRKGISKRKGEISFALNENTDVKNISSTYTDGLLRVTVPVKQPEVHNIDIKVD
jgi:HSP20 family molecular chaperone IbpA